MSVCFALCNYWDSYVYFVTIFVLIAKLFGCYVLFDLPKKKKG
jgi:hypothetical protein